MCPLAASRKANDIMNIDCFVLILYITIDVHQMRPHLYVVNIVNPDLAIYHFNDILIQNRNYGET